MLFKKEFDIDREFFEEKKLPIRKRSIAFKVFIFVFILTFSLLLYSAFTSSFKFGKIDGENSEDGLKTAQSLYYDAIKYYEEGKYDRALELLNKELKIIDDPDAYNYLGKIYKETGDNEVAIEYFKKALDIKPDLFEPNFSLGKIYFELNDMKTASYYFDKALSIRNDNIELLMLAAEAFKNIGNTDSSIELYKQVSAINNDDIIPIVKIGEIYFKRLQYNDAISYFIKALSINFDENAAMYLAKCYFELNDLENASSTIKDILDFNKDNKQAKALLKAIEYKKNSKEEDKITNTINKNETEQKPIDKEALNSYIREIENSIKINWEPPVGTNLKKATVKFTINKDGTLKVATIYATSGNTDFDKSAINAIKNSAPFPPLPDSLNRETLDIIFTFDFNVK